MCRTAACYEQLIPLNGTLALCPKILAQLAPHQSSVKVGTIAQSITNASPGHIPGTLLVVMMWGHNIRVGLKISANKAEMELKASSKLLIVVYLEMDSVPSQKWHWIRFQGTACDSCQQEYCVFNH